MTHWMTSYLPRRSCGQKRPAFSAMYIMIAPDSKTLIGAPPPFGFVIDDRRHAVIGIELEELVVELVATPDIERDDVVWKAALFEQDGDFLAVGRRPVIEIDHWARPSFAAPEYATPVT